MVPLEVTDWTTFNSQLATVRSSGVDAVSATFGSSFPHAALGHKIPGVHWAMDDPAYPRAAEVAAGLVKTSVDMNADSTGHGYARIVGLANQISTSRRVTVHHVEFESATSYSIHPWSGLTGDRQMSCEGYLNGRHWWTVTITGAPSSFWFCFVNSNGNWDGTNRQYTGQASTIDVLPHSSTVSTSRP